MLSEATKESAETGTDPGFAGGGCAVTHGSELQTCDHCKGEHHEEGLGHEVPENSTI